VESHSFFGTAIGLLRQLCGRNILLQIPKLLPIREKSRVLGCQTLNFAYAAFASPLTWGKLA